MIPLQAAVQATRPMTAATLARIALPPARANVAAHRNLIAIELVRTLAESFPTIVRMLGEDAFLDVAAGFVAGEPPTVLASTFYGERFPEFLKHYGGSPSGHYLGDIAAIDAALLTSRQRSEAIAVPYGRFDDPFDDPSARLVLHPSIILLRSKFPAVTGWRANQPRGDGWVRSWGAEDALVACPRLDAELWRLPDGGFACLTTLIAGESLADAAAAGARASAAFDIAEIAAVLVASNIVTDVEPGRRATGRRRNRGRPRRSRAGLG
jgi:hypothetical protein